MVSVTPRPHFTPGKNLVPILQEAGWAPGPVWTGGKSRPHRGSIPDRPARSSATIPTELPGPQQNFIMFIAVLGQYVSILIESSSGPSKIQILEGPEDDSIRIETCCPNTIINIIKLCCV